MKAVIFDIDGTLIDSVDLHAAAWQQAFAKFGHQIPFERIAIYSDPADLLARYEKSPLAQDQPPPPEVPILLT